MAAVGWLMGACSGDSGKTEEESQIERFNTVSDSYADAAAQAHKAAVAAVAAASGDFGVSSLTAGEVSAWLQARAADEGTELDELMAAYEAAYTDALVDATKTRRTLLVQSYRLFEASQPLELQQDAGTQTAALSRVGPGDAKVSTRKQGLLFVTIGALVGAVLLNKTLNDTMDSAVATRTEPVRKKIEQANEAELKEIKEQMGIDASATREQTLEAFAKKPNHEKLDSAKKTEARLVTASVEEADVELIPHEEIVESIVESAKKCGEAAVNQVAGWWATGGGGQGVSQVIEMLGGSATLAAVTDIVVTVSGKQPLDMFSNAISKEMETKVVVDPTGSTDDADTPPAVESVDEAVTLLENDKASAPEVKAAANMVAKEVIEQAGVATTTEADGAISASVPKRTFVQKVEDPEQTNTVPFLNFGPVDMVVVAPGRVPELLADVDSSTPQTVAYTAQPIPDFLAERAPSSKDDDDNNNDSDKCEGANSALHQCLQAVEGYSDARAKTECGIQDIYAQWTLTQKVCVWQMGLTSNEQSVACYDDYGCSGGVVLERLKCRTECYRTGVDCLQTEVPDEDESSRDLRCNSAYNSCTLICDQIES